MIAFFLLVRGKITFDQKKFIDEPAGRPKTLRNVPGGTVDYTVENDVKIIAPETFLPAIQTLKIIRFNKGSELEQIGDKACLGCTSLHNINLEVCKKLWLIGPLAFAFCPLTVLVLPPNIRLIDEAAFFNIDALFIVIPKNTQWIFQKAFAMSTISTVLFEQYSEVKYIGENIVGPTNVKKFEVPPSVVELGDCLIFGRNFSSFEISPGNLFYSYNNSMVFNKEQTKIMSFYDHINFTNFTTPNTIREVESNAFKSTSVKTFKFTNIEKISTSAFESSRIISLVLPKSVKKVGLRAFANCIFNETVVIEGQPELHAACFEDSKFEKGLICNALMIGKLMEAGVPIKAFMF